MNPRIHSLSKLIKERQALLRFIRQEEASGMATADGLDSWHYRQSPEALRFFEYYEKQMAEHDRKQNYLLHALSGVVGTED